MTLALTANRALHRRPGGWSPKELGTLSLWLDADDATTITLSTGVSQWDDKSGNARHVSQATGANQPSYVTGAQNGRAVLRFDGSNDTLSATTSGISAQPFCYVLAVKPATTAGLNRVNYSSDVTFSILDGQWRAFADFPVNIGSASAEAATAVLTFNGSSSTLHVNGTQVGTTFSPGVKHPLTAQVGFTSDAFEGDVMEVMMLTASPSADDRKRLEGYLAHKWGLAGSLPNDHPYRSVAP